MSHLSRGGMGNTQDKLLSETNPCRVHREMSRQRDPLPSLPSTRARPRPRQGTLEVSRFLSQNVYYLHQRRGTHSTRRQAPIVLSRGPQLN